MLTKTVNVKFQSERKENEPDFFEATVTVYYDVDKNYGADMDGGRAIEKLFIDDIKVHNCIDQQATLVELPLSDRLMDDIWQVIWENFEV